MQPILGLRSLIKDVRDGTRRGVRQLGRNLIDSHITPYPDNYNLSVPQRVALTTRYRLAALGIGLTANERNIISFRNSYVGKRIFIIGNGPSLNHIDLSRLKNEITIGVNSIFLAYDRMGFLPTHYVVEDIFVAEDRAKQINALRGTQKGFGNYLRYCLEESSSVNWINVRVRYNDIQKLPQFSSNIAREVWVGGSVTYICMQLAFYFGSRRIYLVGFGHSYAIPKDASIVGNTITSQSDDPNHFHPDYFGRGYRWHDPMVERMEAGYRAADMAFRQAGGQIFNASAGGKLEVFPRVSFEDLFQQEGER